MLVFVAAGLFFLNPHAFVLGARPSAGAFSQSVLLLIYAFTGFEMAAIPAVRFAIRKAICPELC